MHRLARILCWLRLHDWYLVKNDYSDKRYVEVCTRCPTMRRSERVAM